MLANSTPAGGSAMGCELTFAHPEALDLAGGGLGELRHELDVARILEWRKLVLHEGLELGVGRLPAGLQHDECLGPREAFGIEHADHGGLEHSRVLHERR